MAVGGGESEEVGGRSVKVAVGGFDDVRGVNKIYKTNPFKSQCSFQVANFLETSRASL